MDRVSTVSVMEDRVITVKEDSERKDVIQDTVITEMEDRACSVECGK